MAFRSRGVPLYVGPVPDASKVLPGHIGTVAIVKHRERGTAVKTDVVGLTHLHQMINVQCESGQKISSAISGTDISIQFSKDWVAPVVGGIREITLADIKRVGKFSRLDDQMRRVGLTEPTWLTAWVHVTNAPIDVSRRSVSSRQLLLDATAELLLFAETMCPYGVTPSIYDDDSKLKNIRASAIVTGKPTQGNYTRYTLLTSDGPEMYADPTNVDSEALRRMEAGEMDRDAAAQFAQVMAEDECRNFGVKIRLEQGEYLRAIGRLLSHLLTSTNESPFLEAAIEGWQPVRQVFRRSNGKPDSTDDYEDQVVMPRASILRAMADCCAAPMSTAPLDHLPKGSLGGPTENSYVRLMLGKPTVTFPPYPVADAGHSLWIGHKINPMDQSVDARHLASELCTTKVVGDMVSILSACKLKADASVCPLNIDNKVNPADENDDSQYYLSQWLDLAKDMSIENAILAAHDTWIKCLGRKDGELVFDFSDAAFNAATAFGKFVDAFIAKDVGPKPIDANIKRRLGKLLGPAIRAYVQCTRFGLYELNLVMGATCPQEHGIWTKNVMFSHKTTETGDEPSAKRFKFGTEDRHTSDRVSAI